MAISKLHSLLALTGIAAVGTPVAAILVINSKNESHADSSTDSETAGTGVTTKTTPAITPTLKPCPTPDATKTSHLTKIYKDVVGITERTAETTVDDTKLKKWENFMKFYGYDCQGSFLKTTTSGTEGTT